MAIHAGCYSTPPTIVGRHGQRFRRMLVDEIGRQVAPSDLIAVDTGTHLVQDVLYAALVPPCIACRHLPVSPLSCHVDERSCGSSCLSFAYHLSGMLLFCPATSVGEGR